jgi:opacity protein-like surface antigen
MKKRFCIILLLLVSTQFFGQKTKKDESIVFGLKGGLNVSNFINSDIDKQSVRYGYHLGLVSEIIISPNTSFQPELVYSSQGNIQNGVKYKYEYLNIPAVFRFYVKDNISVDAGPQMGFLVNSFNKTSEGNNNISDQNFFDFALCLGATYEFSNNLFLQSRYNLGLININDSDTFKYQNSVIQFSVGYYF